MDYLDLKLALCEADEAEQWERCINLIKLISHCRQWGIEEQARWARKLTHYQMLAALN